jgi:two-component system NtrC family sensor kinase
MTEGDAANVVSVLLVDDNPDFLESAAQFLEAEPGLTVVGRAASGAEAIEMVQTLRPDVVLIDIAMPGMSGLDTTRRIKSRPDAPKVLFVSMYDSMEHRLAAEAAGADGYVGKWEFAGAVVAAIRALSPGATMATRDVRAGRLRTLAHLNHLVSSSLDVDEVLGAISEAAGELMGAPAAAFWMADETARTLVKHSWSNHRVYADLPVSTLRYGEGALGWVAARRRTLHIPDVTRDQRFVAPDWARRHGLWSLVAVPVVLQGALLAVLAIHSRHSVHIGPEEQDLLDAFVAQAAVAIRNARLYDDARRTRDFLQSIAENSADAILTLDVSGRITYFNPRAEDLFGRRAADVMGRRMRELYPSWETGPEDRPVIERQLGDGRAVRSYETVLVAAGGRRIDVSASIAPLRDQTGAVTGTVAVIRDVTDEKRTRQALQQTEKLSFMGSLLAGLAHELNNPLSVLVGRADLLGLVAAERQDGALASVAQQLFAAATRCSRIVTTFLALARRQTPERQAVSLNTVVREALELVAYSLRSDGVEVTVDLEPELPPLWADPHQLHQIVVNLVANAQQSMRGQPGPRRVTVTTRNDGPRRRVALAVTDTGPGVAEEIRARIFEPFFTTKPPGQGTGLGLALCQRIATEHGGTLTVGAGPSGGARFALELPIGDQPPADRPASPHEVPPAPARRRVLVVDDEPSILDVIADMVTASGHHVETSRSGRAALQRLGPVSFDVLLVDVRMPEVDGRDFYLQLERRHPALTRRVVFMTGDALNPETADFIARTSAPMLAKPFTLAELRGVLATLPVEPPSGS